MWWWMNRCDGTAFDFNGRLLTVGGVYDTLLQTVNGCDSAVTLNLMVLDILTTDLTDRTSVQVRASPSMVSP